ncbi:MAG: hypothetical protein HYR92_05355 [Burkholderiales bacterium]|nr:hypothetical protein [Burkholderiales bacterium]
MPKLDSEQVKLHFCALGIADIDAIIAIEEAVYAHPWTRGNFLDSFYSDHQSCGLRDESGELISVLLEVRVSNTRAIAVYEQFGFRESGRRKGYYPADQGRREDAIVMRISC